MDIKAGSVVLSLAGHDKGRAMVVTKVDGGNVFVADGKERRLDKPKKKNRKHVRITHYAIELTELTDKRLRRTLREMFERTEE
ncbi:MAG: KOW domain-containing RNA-binding protein [Oscillospiraceae bacterium]|nr:KOW domain-containing RNA-binding protein [Oscillospiraceae bacterium]